MENTGICLLIWVISECNLKCPLCVVKDTQESLIGYEMSIDEVNEIIRSSKERGIHYNMIQFTGGEPTLWKNLKEATELFYNSGITNSITLISNGSHPDKIFEIYPMLSSYAISATQSTKKQLEIFKSSGHNVLYNFGEHINLPISPVPNSLPAVCCNRFDYLNKPTNQLHYINGTVYYCCYAQLLKNKVGITTDLYCDFKSDFISKFSDKKYDKEICRYCLCYNNVWDFLHNKK